MAASLAVETWIWYTVCTILFLLRILARSLHFGGLHRLKIEDAIMLFAFICYTSEIVFMNIVVHEESNLLLPGYLKHHKLTGPEIENRTYGSKITLVVEQCQCCCIWAIKVCLIFMYYRLTKTAYPKHNLAVKILAVYVALGFLFMEAFYFGLWCKPFSDYWAVPTPNPRQCAAAWNHLITNAVLNLSSDLALVVIGLSMALSLKFPPRRKYALLMLISMGLFVVACAAANKAYSFTNPFGSQWTFWYIRECSTAVLIANLPYVFTLARRLLGFSDKPSHSHSGRRGSSPSKVSRLLCTKANTKEDDEEAALARMPSIPEFAYYSPGRHKASDQSSYSPNRSRFEQSRNGSHPHILGKADYLAFQAMEDWELPIRTEIKAVSPGSTPGSTSFPSRPGSAHMHKSTPSVTEVSIPRGADDYEMTGGSPSDEVFSSNELMTALPQRISRQWDGASE